MMHKKQIIFLVIIILLGSFLRIYGLEKESLWMDEAYTFDSIKQKSLGDVLSSVEVNEFHNPPVYYILLHYWALNLGNSEFILRLFSALFGILSILIVFLVGKEIFDSQTGLISALIMSLSVIDILYSQEIRTYTFFSFFALVSFYYFVRILKSTNITDSILYFLSSAAMIYILPFWVIVLALQNIFIFIFYSAYKKRIKLWILEQSLLFLSFIPQIPNFLKMFKQNYVITFSYVDKYGAPEILKNTFFTASILIILFIISILSLFYFRTRIRHFFEYFKLKDHRITFLLLLILIGFAYFLMTPLLIRPIFLTRYSLFLLPVFYVLLAKGISQIDPRQKSTFVLFIILLLCYPLFFYYSQVIKEDWRGASYYIQQNSKNSEPIIVCPTDMVFKYYYSGDSLLLNPKNYGSISEIETNLLDQGYWVVFSPNHTGPKICGDIISNKEIVINKTFKGIIVYHTL